MLAAACHPLPDGAGHVAEFRGTISAREHEALPAGASIVVELVEMDADPPVVVVRSKSRTDGPMPVPYELKYDPTEPRRGAVLGLRARIEVDGKAWSESPAPERVYASEVGQTVDLMLQRVP